MSVTTDGAEERVHEPGEHPDLPPPPSTVGVLGWLRTNLFAGPFNSFLTILAIYLVVILVPPFFNWVFVDSVISGDSKWVCDAGRRASRMGTAMQNTSFDPWTKATDRQVTTVTQYLSQTVQAYKDLGKAAPPELAALIQSIQPEAAIPAMKEAAKTQNAAVVSDYYASLAPLAAWGDARDGACWTFVKMRFGQFIYGFYPSDQRWRIDLGFILLILWAAPLFVRGVRHKTSIGLSLLILYPIIAYYLFTGGIFGLEVVETPKWGGLFLTLVIAMVGIVASLPIGIVLALGRRSNMPAIRAICIGFIELWRGVPLISVLFMASVMLPLFLPEGVNFDKLLRALIGVALFSAAYMAEVVRGGLQAIPKGQYEAAAASGLTYWQMMRLVILPQALKLVIPGIVSTFIGLFKDTTLVLIIGLFDLLGIAQAATQDPNWLGMTTEAYVAAGFGFWIFCFSMSRYSIYIEHKLHTGHKRN
jgi:general L-amino acid transport system permease protein